MKIYIFILCEGEGISDIMQCRNGKKSSSDIFDPYLNSQKEEVV
jgi:hypothetical protein